MANAATISRYPVWLFKLSIVAFTLFVLFLSYYIFCRYKIKQLNYYNSITHTHYQEPVFPKLTQAQIVNLGWAHKEVAPPRTMSDFCPASSYIHFDTEKKKGVVRVGIFGCSYTEGSETGYGFDFTSLVQKRLHEQGYDQIEVINFGVGSYGIHQSYLLFDYLGKQYDLDVVIVNAYDFHKVRDNTFVYANNYAPIHARFILEGEQLKLVPVIGKSRQEAIQKYHSFIPPLQYWWYDVKVPNCLSYFFKKENNPFYHVEDKAEIEETYKRIFKKWATEVKNVVLFTHDPEMRSLAVQLAKEHTNIYHYPTQSDTLQAQAKSLHLASMGHDSPLQNQFIADELVNLLTQTPEALKYMAFDRLQTPDSAIQTSVPSLALYEYDSMYFQIDTIQYHYLHLQRPGSNTWKWQDTLDIKKNKVSAFALSHTKEGDMFFSAVPNTVAHNDILNIIIETESQHIKQKIGIVKQIAPSIYDLQPLQKLAFDKSKNPSFYIKKIAENQGDYTLYSLHKFSNIQLTVNQKALPFPSAPPKRVTIFPNNMIQSLAPQLDVTVLHNTQAMISAWMYEIYLCNIQDKGVLRTQNHNYFDVKKLKKTKLPFNIVLVKGNEKWIYPIAHFKVKSLLPKELPILNLLSNGL